MNALLRRTASTALVLATAAALASCGDSPSAEPPTTAPPDPVDTQPQQPGQSEKLPANLVTRADSVCTRTNKQVDALGTKGIHDPKTLHQLTVAFEDAASELEKVKPPKENKVAWERFAGAFSDGRDLIVRLETEVRTGDKAAYEQVAGTLDEIDGDVKDLAMQYGFEKCAAG